MENITWYKISDTLQEIQAAMQPHKPALIEADAHKICLLPTPEGLKALANACPHLGAPLHRGNVNYLGEVTCPWHNYRFNGATGHECEGRSSAARTYPMRIDESGVYVGIVQKSE